VFDQLSFLAEILSGSIPLPSLPEIRHYVAIRGEIVEESFPPFPVSRCFPNR